MSKAPPTLRPYRYRPELSVRHVLVLVLVLALVGFLAWLVIAKESGSKVTPLVASEMNPFLNRLLGSQVLPTDDSDKYVFAEFLPNQSRSLTDGWQEYVVNVRTGWCRLQLTARQGDQVSWIVVDSTYEAYSFGHHEWNGRSILGELAPWDPGHRLTPTDWARRDPSRFSGIQQVAMRATAPLGGLMLRRGSSEVPVAITWQQGTWSIAKPWLRSANRPEPLYLALNLLSNSQHSGPKRDIRGTYTVRVKVEAPAVAARRS